MGIRRHLRSALWWAEKNNRNIGTVDWLALLTERSEYHTKYIGWVQDVQRLLELFSDTGFAFNRRYARRECLGIRVCRGQLAFHVLGGVRIWSSCHAASLHYYIWGHLFAIHFANLLHPMNCKETTQMIGTTSVIWHINFCQATSQGLFCPDLYNS